MPEQSIPEQALPEQTLPDQAEKGQVLIAIARASIAEAFGQRCDLADDADWLQQPGACFVTLTQDEQLRGCVGTLEAHRSLGDDVRANAQAAAFRDTRFGPLTETELDITGIEVSLLSAMQPLEFESETDALQQLRPGIDGVVLEYKQFRSTFLPQVWEQLPGTEAFIAHLKHKAGLPASFWADEIRLQRYTVTKWKERDLDVADTTRTEMISGSHEH